jgi:glucan phosphoethanolaminetransferase (alkaline phosphatase superfamily)
MLVPRFVRQLATDAAFWFCLPCAFLLIYVGFLRQPVSAVIPHLWAMALPFAVLSMLRLVLSRAVPRAKIHLLLATLVLSLFMGAMLTYYVLAFISVRFWGAIVAMPAIPTFFRQAPDIAEAVGLHPLVAGAGALVLIAAVLFACWSFLRRCDWTRELGPSGWKVAIVASAAGCALWLVVANATEAPWINAAEPLSLTLFPLAGTRNIEGHLVTDEKARALDRIEDQARARYVPGDASPKQNLILIVVDALRPANMSLYGYGRKTTPFLDELARTQSVRKFIAHAPCSDTGCGLLSLTGSKLPGDFSFRPFSLHEALRRNGYRIHVLQSGDHTYFHPMRGYYGEIDTWLDGNSVPSSSIDDDQILLDKLATMPDWDGTPAMFHFHLMSAHVTRKDDGRRDFAPASSYLFPPRSDGSGADIIVPTATNYYDNGILGADHVIEALVGKLQQKGYLQHALIVVTADHGEALGEHGIFAHANSVREEVLKVPVVFVAKGYQPEKFVADSSFPLQIDIAPTILDELNIPRPATWKGKPLQTPYEPFVAYFEERDSAGIIDTRHAGKQWKYWIDFSTGDEFVFELGADPHEAHNVAGSVSHELLRDWRNQVVYARPRR